MTKPLPFISPINALQNSINNNPSTIAIHLIESSGERFNLTYSDVDLLIRRGCTFYEKQKLQRGNRIILALPASRLFIGLYFAALQKGIIPVVVPPITSKNEKLLNIYNKIEAKGIFIHKKITLSTALEGLNVVVIENLVFLPCDKIESIEIQSGDIAHLQPTSGSTGTPKLAVITHNNLVSNVFGIGKAIKHRKGDKLLLWLPLSHDMGLVGLSYALFWQCPLILTVPSKFVRNPISWLRMISEYGGTLSPAPNSAFHICARLARRKKFEGLDLSSWRVALCGSEPVHEETITNFQKVFADVGYQPETMLPVYGLAEATLAVSIPTVSIRPIIESIDSKQLSQNLIATLSTNKSSPIKRMVNLGMPIDGHQVRIVDKTNNMELTYRQIGEVQVKGPSIIKRYWGKEASNDNLITSDGFLCTGDLGYLTKDGLYIIGRLKEIIIINGKNYISNDIEKKVKSILDPIYFREVITFSSTNPSTYSEQLHISVEYLPRAKNEFLAETENKIVKYLFENLGLRNVQVHWAQKGQIPKTTSGKLQRHLCKEIFLG